MDSEEHRPLPTLAHKLGEAAHVSGLAVRLRGLSGAGERLLKVAVERGAKHYQRTFDPGLPADHPIATDEEIGVALCLGQHRYVLDNLRAAAQLLSSEHVDAVRLCRLAVQERCEPVFLHLLRWLGSLLRN